MVALLGTERDGFRRGGQMHEGTEEARTPVRDRECVSVSPVFPAVCKSSLAVPSSGGIILITAPLSSIYTAAALLGTHAGSVVKGENAERN